VNADRLRIPYFLLNAKSMMRRQLKLPDWIFDAAYKWNCPDDYWEGIYTENVLEHLSYRDVVVALKEAYRTLQPGRWLRVLLPDLKRYIEFYNGKASGQATNGWFNERFAHGAEAIAFLTQNQNHASVWDGKLLSAVLAEIGFANVAEVTFGCGADRRLIKDNISGRHESLYVEAQKPAAH
jgi:predicted SAM-dependent methyltransferase